MFEQLSLFDHIRQGNDFPCDDCVFDKHGCCSHIQNEDYFCVQGSFRVRHSQIICPSCGKQMDLIQSDFGNDGAKCRCGTHKIFNNRGNRPTALELWRQGLLIGR